jgi:hypothetical protein
MHCSMQLSEFRIISGPSNKPSLHDVGASHWRNAMISRIGRRIQALLPLINQNGLFSVILRSTHRLLAARFIGYFRIEARLMRFTLVAD